MLHWLAIGGYVIAYFSIGYGWGKLLNKEFLNDTPTKKLGYLKRMKRILLFPLSSYEWDERTKPQNANECPIALRHGFDAESSEGFEKYCKALSLLWPLTLVPLAIGIVEVPILTVWHGFDKIGDVIHKIFHRSDLDRVHTLLRTAKESAEARLTVFESQRETYRNLQKKFTGDALQSSCARLLALLESLAQETKSYINGIDADIREISTVDEEAEGYQKILNTYGLLEELNIDIEKERSEIETAKESALTRRRLLVQKYQRKETEVLCSPKLNTSIEEIEEQIRATGKEQHRLALAERARLESLIH